MYMYIKVINQKQDVLEQILIKKQIPISHKYLGCFK